MTDTERNKTIYIRKLKKRIAYLEEKLLAIREITTLWDKGNAVGYVGGAVKRQAMRIDTLEGKLLTIRELANIFADSSMRADEGRHIGESRVKQGVGCHSGFDFTGGKFANINEGGES